MNKRVCVVCETPYQLFNAIKFCFHQNEFDEKDIDLFICNRDIKCNQIDRIKQLKIVGNIYVFKNDMNEVKEMNKPLIRIERFLFPKKFITRRLVETCLPDFKSYGYLICAFPISFVIALTMINPDMKIRIMEDGIGTYIGNLPNPNSLKKDILFALKRKKSPWKNINEIYLNNPNFFENNNAMKVIDMSLEEDKQESFSKVINNVFSYTNCDLYDDNKYIYLTQPFSVMSENYRACQETENKILKKLATIEGGCVLRKHPKQNDFKYDEMLIDKIEDLWELVCYKQLTNKHILIGVYSTAQFTPKILYDIEPEIVFTFEMYQELFDEKKKKEMRMLVGKLKDSYSIKDKIVSVHNLEELNVVLNRNVCS